MGLILGNRFRKWVDPATGNEGLTYWCEGCQSAHGIRTKGEHSWYWNGDAEKPVFGPSVLTTGKKKLTEEQYQRIIAGEKIEVPDEICHTFVGCNGAQPGEVIFLGDCTHALAGQVRPFPELPDWLKT